MQTTANEATTQSQMVSLSFSSQMSKEDEEMARSALSAFRVKEDEIEKRKLEVRERVKAQLGRVEEETRRLANIREVCFEFFGGFKVLNFSKISDFEAQMI